MKAKNKDIDKSEYIHKTDSWKAWTFSANMLKIKLLEVVNSIDNPIDYPAIIKNILEVCHGFEYHQNNLISVDYISNGGNEKIYWGKQTKEHNTAYYISSKKEIIENLEHFVGYYILDDGELSLEDGYIVYPKIENNISPDGLALYILEQLGEQVPCQIVDERTYGTKIFVKTESFSEALEEMKKLNDVTTYPNGFFRMDISSYTGYCTHKIMPQKYE